jgi:hypothetical protein
MGRAEDLFERLLSEGEAAVDRMIAERASEELFLDFKRSADDGGSDRLHQNDRVNLAKVISGFGNSEGGVVLWGVDARAAPGTGDVAQVKRPLADTPRFVSLLEGAVSGSTVPAHAGVRSGAILRPRDGTGFAVTLVPKSSRAPHQSIAHVQFFMRAGSDFVPVPYAVLQGMFGRRPQADIFHMWSARDLRIHGQHPEQFIGVRIGVLLATHGPGIVRDLFVTAEFGCPATFSTLSVIVEAAGWQGGHGPGDRTSLVSPDGFKLAPGGITRPLSFDIALRPPFYSGFHLELLYGHRDSETKVARVEASPEQLTLTCQGALTAGRFADPLAFLQGALGLSELSADA